MKEKRTYKRFDLIAFLAILGCIGMLLFEGIFIFELYNRAPAQVADMLPVQATPTVSQPPVAVPPAASLPKSTAVEAPVSAPAVKAPVVVPARREPVESVKPVEPVEPTNTPPAEIETAPVISVLLG